MVRSCITICAFAVLASACTMNGTNPFTRQTDNGASAMSQPGTCYAYVTTETDGTFTLLTGVGDGTTPPQALAKRGLSAPAVDAAVIKETEIMRINPECLSTYVSPRENAQPAS